MTRYFRIVACACALSVLPGCTGTGIVSTPAAVSSQTKLDEQAALTMTLAYTAAARAAALAIETGVVSDQATIARIGELDRRAYAAVQAAERAYRAGNATSLATALSEARQAVSLFLSSVKG